MQGIDLKTVILGELGVHNFSTTCLSLHIGTWWDAEEIERSRGCQSHHEAQRAEQVRLICETKNHGAGPAVRRSSIAVKLHALRFLTIQGSSSAAE